MLTDIRALADHFLIALPNINKDLMDQEVRKVLLLLGKQP